MNQRAATASDSESVRLRTKKKSTLENAAPILSIGGSIASMIAVIFSFFGVTSASISQDLWTWILCAAASLIALVFFVIAFRGYKQGTHTWSAGALISGTIIIASLSIFLLINMKDNMNRGHVSSPGVSNPATASSGNSSRPDVSFNSIWSPPLEQQQVQTGAVAEMVRGVELEARLCPREATEFTLREIPSGSEVSFSLESYAPGGPEGIYELQMVGAGIDERWTLHNTSAERVNVRTTSDDDISLTLQALHDLEGQDCRDTREVVAFNQGVVN